MGRLQQSAPQVPRYPGQTCQVQLDRPRDNGDATCGLAAVAEVDGIQMCSGHHALARLPATLVGEANSKAREWLMSRGVSPEGKSRAEYTRDLAALRASVMAHRPGHRDWALKILTRQADGEILPAACVKNARDALAMYQDSAGEAV